MTQFDMDSQNSQVHVSENLWQSLEEELVPSAATSRSNWLDSQIKSSSRRNNDSAVCVAGGMLCSILLK